MRENPKKGSSPAPRTGSSKLLRIISYEGWRQKVGMSAFQKRPHICSGSHPRIFPIATPPTEKSISRYSFSLDFHGAGPPHEKEPADLIQRSLRWRAAAGGETMFRGKLREVWCAPPYLTAQDPHPWRDLLASSGLSITATELRRNKAVKGLIAGIHLWGPNRLCSGSIRAIPCLCN